MMKYEADRGKKCIDYSHANVAQLPEKYHDKIIVLPILCFKAFLFPRQTILYDVGFIGTMTGRRKAIVEQLQSKFRTLVINTFDMTEKNKQVLQCRILINIHAGENYQVFEFTRCVIPIYNGVPILSEDTPNNKFEKGLNKLIVETPEYVPYDKLVDAVPAMLERYKDRTEHPMPDLARFIEASNADLQLFRSSIS